MAKDEVENVFRHHWFGNGVADVLATVAATRAMPPQLTCERLEINATLAFIVSMRIAVVEWLHQEALHKPDGKWTCITGPGITSVSDHLGAMQNTYEVRGHNVYWAGQEMTRCLHCGIKKTKLQFDWWFNNPCSAKTSHAQVIAHATLAGAAVTSAGIV